MLRLSRSAISLVAIATLAAAQSSQIFREALPAETHITWCHENGKSARHYLPEMAGAGVAIFDYNNDGWMDILLVNSGPADFYEPSHALHQALYRNNRDGTYTDVASQAGLSTELFGMGVAIGDYDGDGYQDIFIAGVGRCALYHNNGDGTFTDVTKQSGIVASQWSTSALWFDFDNDGKLDLFVAEFADYTNRHVCSLAESYGGKDVDLRGVQAYYCHPNLFKPSASHIYRNLGNGKFNDVSAALGIAIPGKAWAAVATDINGDGYLDLFVSNDTMPNMLWLNDQGKRFEDVALQAGVAYSSDGVARSGMGVDAADFDGDGANDLIVGNIDAEMTSLYRNLGDGIFDDVNMKSSIGPETHMLSTWGLRFLDFDNDGLQDLIECNGHPDDSADQRHNGTTFRQPLLLFHQLASRRFVKVNATAGPAFSAHYSGRGLAVGDLNNDGYPDVVFTENGGPPHILMNTALYENNWLGLDLRPKIGNRDAIGAMIRWSVDGAVFTRIKTAGGSYLSSSDPRELLGTGKHTIDWVEIHWPAPSTNVDRINRPVMNRYLRLDEGSMAARNSGVSK